MATAVVNYSIDRGALWERLVVIRNRRTHRYARCTDATAAVRVDGSPYKLPSQITAEGVMLTLTPEQTEWFEPGTYPWDLVATVTRRPWISQTALVEMLVVRGTLTVTEYENIAPLASDGNPEALEPFIV